MTHVRITRLDGRPFAGTVLIPPYSFDTAWTWAANIIAANFDCLPEDVGCDECPEGGADIVTVCGEAVARISVDSQLCSA